MNEEKVFKRYSRQIFIEEIGVSGQRKIMAAKVLIIGAGGLGSPVIQYLAASGVGEIGVVDDDCIELHNLNRQVIHSEAQVGKAKVDSAVHFVQSLNSAINLIPIHAKITKANALDLIRDYDIVVDGSDNFTTRYLVNDTCVILGKPLVYGSILAYEGQTAVFNLHGSKNLRDIFPESPNEDLLPDCDSRGVLGPLAGIIGSMMAMHVLKIITGLPIAINTLTIVDTYHEKTDQVVF
ncbi:HesA/MoeB/ThiF family protein [Sphingobacterium wenxiniae]|uniref:Molybdopterin-synthase adenylyltransferase n=1 Tax=Sphingobacterium wenxiniae TaxID=683125 RepID=A0A1I6PZX9_9SPHI|nr:HesA/MoeB/ThiF family protein [Sphingobacterium wenxiniae]SFS45789.1 adenylyltransferase and sulfurtransferase [Sphingobacterium wenxiniae]